MVDSFPQAYNRCMHETQPAPLNPEGEIVNMDAADSALEESNEVEGSSDPQVVRDVIEKLQSAHESLKDLGSSLGGSVRTKIIALEHEIGRLEQLKKLPTRH